MSSVHRLTAPEREEIESLIKSFDDHGCGMGLDIKAQAALRRLLDALDQSEETVRECEAMITKLVARVALDNHGIEA